MIRKIRYIVEGAGLFLMLFFFRLLPIDWASGLGGGIAKRLGPRLGISRIARQNLHIAFPYFDKKQVEATVTRMWDNLGRTLAEYPHLGHFYPSGRVEIVGAENVIRLRDDGIGGIFFSAHYGNWELLSLSLDHLNLAPVLVYRPANNPLAERLIQKIRQRAHRLPDIEYVPKTSEGMRAMVQALRTHKHLAMLVDQKMNKGIAVPLFGREAMTAPAIAQLALKYQIPVVPAKMERVQGARFRITLFPPVTFQKTDHPDQDIAAMMQWIHSLFEAWITERPDHWLWIHKRWSKQIYGASEK